MQIKVEVDYKDCARLVGVEVPRALPYAVAAMVTALTQDGKAALQKKLPEAFDRPTPFTQRGVFTRNATKAKPEGEVFVPDSEQEQGKAPREFLRAGADGTTRRPQKRTEYLLTKIGALPAGWVTTPGKGAALDQYGNLPGSVYKQIINVLQIRYNKPKAVSKRSQKAATKLGVAALFFAVAPGVNQLGKSGGWLPPGVWKHEPGGRIKQILKFVRKASYKRRLDVEKEVRKAVVIFQDRRWAEASAAIVAKFSSGPLQ